MSPPVATTAAPAETALTSTQLQLTRFPVAVRLASYLELAKPRIAVMVLIAMGVGYTLGAADGWLLWPLLNTGLGVLFAVVASSAFNQAIEAGTDARMFRTQDRPIPLGRLSVREVSTFAGACAVFSVAYLAITVNVPTALLTAGTIAVYAGVYTPLKKYTTICTAMGAIPGAAPPVIGWVAAGGSLNLSAFSLFAILFVWQFPHFLAIAWMYKDEYLGAGLKMLPGAGRLGIVGPISLAYALVLIPVSLLPHRYGLASDFYAGVALSLGAVYAYAAFRFACEETRTSARWVLFASLVYLPGVLLAMMCDHFRLLNLLIS